MRGFLAVRPPWQRPHRGDVRHSKAPAATPRPVLPPPPPAPPPATAARAGNSRSSRVFLECHGREPTQCVRLLWSELFTRQLFRHSPTTKGVNDVSSLLPLIRIRHGCLGRCRFSSIPGKTAGNIHVQITDIFPHSFGVNTKICSAGSGGKWTCNVLRSRRSAF